MCVSRVLVAEKKIVEFSLGFLRVGVASVWSDVDMKEGKVCGLMKVMIGLDQLVTLGKRTRKIAVMIKY